MICFIIWKKNHIPFSRLAAGTMQPVPMVFNIWFQGPESSIFHVGCWTFQNMDQTQDLRSSAVSPFLGVTNIELAASSINRNKTIPSWSLQGTNISYLGERNIIFKYTLGWGYVSFQEGNLFHHPSNFSNPRSFDDFDGCCFFSCLPAKKRILDPFIRDLMGFRQVVSYLLSQRAAEDSASKIQHPGFITCFWWKQSG